MEVACLQNLAEAFKDVEKSFAVIGGCACSQWFAESGLRFRNTRDSVVRRYGKFRSISI